MYVCDSLFVQMITLSLYEHLEYAHFLLCSFFFSSKSCAVSSVGLHTLLCSNKPYRGLKKIEVASPLHSVGSGMPSLLEKMASLDFSLLLSGFLLCCLQPNTCEVSF